MTASWILLLALGATEQWADEPVPLSEPPKVSSPRVGPVGGVHLGVSAASVLGPDVGARGGVRVRLGDHMALSVFADAEFVWFPPPPLQPVLNPIRGQTMTAQPLLAERLIGFARIELIGSSASSIILMPKLSVGLYLGAGAGLVPGQATVGLLSGGLHLGITRLEPSGWWFPVFLDLGLEGTPLGGGATWRFALGVGL